MFVETLIYRKVYSTYKRPKTDRSAERKNAVWLKTGDLCSYCGCVLIPFGNEKRSFTIEHKIPIHHGGSDTLENLVSACLSCNCKKGMR